MVSAFQFATDVILDVLGRSFDGVALVSGTDRRIVFANSTLQEWSGKRKEAIEGIPIENLVGKDWKIKNVCFEIDRVATGALAQAEVAIASPFANCALDSVRLRVFRISGSKHDDAILGLIFHREGISPYSPLAHALRLDPLTNLPDRAFLVARLATLLEGDRATDREFALVFIDLDNFKHINDRHGHLLGDRVLRVVASRLTECIRQGDHVTRYGGDEFVILLEHVTGWTDIEPVVSRIRTALARPIELPEGRFDVSLSLGVTQAAAHHRIPEDLIRDADRSMYAAKRSGA